MRYIIFLSAIAAMLFQLPAQQPIDLAEKILKLEKINGLGKVGFGLYDTGDNKYKIFDWNIRKTTEIPVPMGEGKAEIKFPRVDAFIHENNLYIRSKYTKKINVFDMKGTFIRDFILDVGSCSIKFFNQKIYAFNNTFFISKNGYPSELFKTFDLKGKILDTVNFKGKIALPTIYDKNPDYLSYEFLFDIDETGDIYILDPINLFIYNVNAKGDINSKTKIPFKIEIVFTRAKVGEKEMVFLDVRKHYSSFKVFNGDYYVLYMELSGNRDNIQRKASLLKIKKDGTFTKKILSGNLEIIDENNGTLYLYDEMEFFIYPVDLKNWK